MVQVDGAYCGVVFQRDKLQQRTASSTTTASFDKRQMRLMRKDDLQIVSNTTIPKSPDSLQKIPRKITLPHTAKNHVDLIVDPTGMITIISWSLIVQQHMVSV